MGSTAPASDCCTVPQCHHSTTPNLILLQLRGHHVAVEGDECGRGGGAAGERGGAPCGQVCLGHRGLQVDLRLRLRLLRQRSGGRAAAAAAWGHGVVPARPRSDGQRGHTAALRSILMKKIEGKCEPNLYFDPTETFV